MAEEKKGWFKKLTSSLFGKKEENKPEVIESPKVDPIKEEFKAEVVPEVIEAPKVDPIKEEVKAEVVPEVIEAPKVDPIKEEVKAEVVSEVIDVPKVEPIKEEVKAEVVSEVIDVPKVEPIKEEVKAKVVPEVVDVPKVEPIKEEVKAEVIPEVIDVPKVEQIKEEVKAKVVPEVVDVPKVEPIKEEVKAEVIPEVIEAPKVDPIKEEVKAEVVSEVIEAPKVDPIKEKVKAEVVSEVIEAPKVEPIKEEVKAEVVPEVIEAPKVDPIKEEVKAEVVPEVIEAPKVEPIKEEVKAEVVSEVIEAPKVESIKEEVKAKVVPEVVDVPKVEQIKEEAKAEVVAEVVDVPKVEETKEEPVKKGWFSKVVDTLNAPIEIKIETADGDDSWLAKLKGNISIGLGEPVKKETDEEREQWKERLKDRLSKTRQAFVDKLERLMHGRKKIDEDLLEEIEEVLLESDVGVEMTEKIVDKLRSLAKEKRFLPEEVMPSLFDFLKDQLHEEEQRIVVDDSRLNIIMMVGVNGTGKTTTTGKIAAKLRISDYSVVLAAADTFRAAAIDQLEVWSKRAQVPLIRHQENSDAAAVVFDAIKSAQAKKTNVLLIDTAGRLHNKVNLMEELRKIRRIIDREAPDAKLEVLLVLDATTGQNGLKQAMVFAEAVHLTGVVLTKLDGTAKGGVIFSIKDSLEIPIKLVGVGEGIEDLRDFESQLFIDALFSQKQDNVIEESTKK